MAPLLLSGCYGGTAGLILAITEVTDDDGGRTSTNAPLVVSDVEVTETRTSPATVHFVLTDRESDPADVKLLFFRPDFAVPIPAPAIPAPLAGDTGFSGLATSPQGEAHTLLWAFAEQVGERYQEGFRVEVSAVSGPRAEAAVSTSEAFSLGNDCPEIRDPRLPVGEDGEVVGIVNVTLEVSDSSDDIVSIKVEYHIEGEDPQRWPLARPATLSLPPDQELPADFKAIENVQAGRDGRTVDFFWDAPQDLGTREADVKLRFTVDDGLCATELETDVFRVDNNDPPVARLNDVALEVNPDRKGGIPVSFEVFDAESDAVQVVFQWRRATEGWPPDLPPDARDLAEILARPDKRREYRIARARPVVAEGRVALAGDPSGRRVRLPELAGTAAAFLLRGLVGKDLEILRASSVPEPVGEAWDLRRPVAAAPLGDGITALVLDEPSESSWRLREVGLGSGKVAEEIVSSAPGKPLAMDLERGRESVIVAIEREGAWKVLRVALEKEPHTDPTVLVTPAHLVPPGAAPQPVRCLLSLGDNAALMTAGGSLLRLVYFEGFPAKAVVLLDDLATPWGLALDPLVGNRVYLAERDFKDLGRIISLDLTSLVKTPLATNGIGFPRPQSLALERSGTRLLAITQSNAPSGNCELRGINLRAAEEVFEIARKLPRAGSLATGPDGLRVITLPDEDRLAVGGGLAQRRTITECEVSTSEISVDRAFEPPLAPLERWRISDRGDTVMGSPAWTRGTFVMDTDEFVRGEEIFLRIVAYDTERGLGQESRVRLRIVQLFGEEVEELVDPRVRFPRFASALDLDADGDLDLVSANHAQAMVGQVAERLAVYLQRRPGVFGQQGGKGEPAQPDDGIGETTGYVIPITSVEGADIDGDGLLDLVSGDYGRGTLRVFLQEPSKQQLPSFQDPVTLGDKATDTPFWIEVADLDQDGLLDLVAANGKDANLLDNDLEPVIGDETVQLSVFYQTTPGQFADRILLGSPPEVVGARAVQAVDLDDDGDLDLISANRDSNNVTIFFQKAPRAFGLEGGMEPDCVLGDERTTRGARFVEPVDIDRDGDLDLVVANGDPSIDVEEGQRNLQIYFQTSPGVFGCGDGLVAAPVRSAVVPDIELGNHEVTKYPMMVTVADLDGDTDLDLVAANLRGNVLTAFFQTGLGVFEPDPLTFGRGRLHEPTSLLARDLQADGKVTILVTNPLESGPSLVLFSSARRATFRGEPLRLRGLPAPPGFLAAGDLDRDGDLDIAVAGNSRRLTVLLQSSPRFFEPESFSIESPGVPRSVVAVDLDQDGDIDLLSANQGRDTLSVLRQVNPGEFQPEWARGHEALEHETVRRPTAIAAADLDGDGDLDLVSANERSDTLTLFFQVEGALPSSPSWTLELPEGSGPVALVARDLDGDGRVDLVAGNADGANLAVFFQSPSPPPRVDLKLDPARVWPEGPGVGPLPGDRAEGPRAAPSGAALRELPSWWTTKGAPKATFQPEPTQTLSRGVTGPRSIAAADLDGDGDLDLAAADPSSGSLTVFFQRRPQWFDPEPLVVRAPDTVDEPVSVATGDIDGDGDEDLVVANSVSDRLTVWLQRSPGRFGEYPAFVASDPGRAFSPLWVTVVDLDGDGDLDLVSANAASGEVTVFFGGE